MTNYEAWSLEDLKSAAADLDVAALSSHSSTFFDGGQALQSIGDSFSDALNYLAGGWKGEAAQGAATSAQSSISTVTDTQSMATQGHDATEVYAFDTRSQMRDVAAIPDVDTGWGHALSSGFAGGFTGIALAKYKQHEEYEKNRAEAAKIVGQIDSRGKEQASAMKDQQWPAKGEASAPPQPLQPPATRAPAPTPSSSGGSASDYTPGSGYAGHVAASNHDTGFVSETTPQHHGHVVSTISGPYGGSTTPTSAQPPTGAAAPVLAGTPVEAAAASGGPGLAGSLGLAGGAAAVAGGAAVLGGGPLAGQLRTAGGSGSRGLGGSERSGEFGRGTGKFGRSGSEPGRSSGRAPIEGRAGAGLPGDAERVGTLGRAAAGEALGRGSTGTGAYPPGGAGRGRNDDDEELRARPDWLMEQDDIWGDGRLAAPPVLG